MYSNVQVCNVRIPLLVNQDSTFEVAAVSTAERIFNVPLGSDMIWPGVITSSILGRMNIHWPPILMFTWGTGF